MNLTADALFEASFNSRYYLYFTMTHHLEKTKYLNEIGPYDTLTQELIPKNIPGPKLLHNNM